MKDSVKRMKRQTIDWEKLLQTIRSTKDSYLEYSTRSQSSTVNIYIYSTGKWQTYEEIFFWEWYTDGKWVQENTINITSQ